jgi:hypothetical protein
MTGYEHPEELLDQARQGGLAPEMQAILDRHLVGCSVCAYQLALAARFERDLSPQPRDEILHQRAVEGAIRRMQQSPLGRRKHAPPRWSRWAVAAVLLMAGITAAAVIGRRIGPPAPIPPRLPAAEPPAPRLPLPPVEAAPAEAPVPPEFPPPKSTPARHASPRSPAITAAALFEQGEKLRREGHADAAIATYRRLQATFPATAEARLSFAFGGELLLKQGRAADALVQFDRHLSLDGEVGEEALAGRATALEQLHRMSEAAAAWRSLLSRYPRSIYVERTRERLEQLTGHP